MSIASGTHHTAMNRVSATIPTQRQPTTHRWPNQQVAAELWSQLIWVRNNGDPQFVADAEDAVFWFYTPLAREIAVSFGETQDAGRTICCAELGLAKAILIWTLPDVARFEEYARRAIHAELAHQLGYAPIRGNSLLSRVRPDESAV